MAHKWAAGGQIGAEMNSSSGRGLSALHKWPAREGIRGVGPLNTGARRGRRARRPGHRMGPEWRARMCLRRPKINDSGGQGQQVQRPNGSSARCCRLAPLFDWHQTATRHLHQHLATLLMSPTLARQSGDLGAAGGLMWRARRPTRAGGAGHGKQGDKESHSRRLSLLFILAGRPSPEAWREYSHTIQVRWRVSARPAHSRH